MNESRRLDYLNAMQVMQWLPRAELPFAAPSRVLVYEEQEPEAESVTVKEQPWLPPGQPLEVHPSPSLPIVPPKPQVVASPSPPTEPSHPPRFALQLMKAGSCLLLIDLPTGYPFQARDPACLLLKDMLRAAGLPESPQILGEPVRWPLLSRGNIDQGPEAARDFVQSFTAFQIEENPCTCLWLFGLSAIKYAGNATEECYGLDFEVEGLGRVWALPGLEMLMDEPGRKARVWKAMRRLMRVWSEAL